VRRFVLDASAILKAFFPDEEGQAASQALLGDWVKDRVEIIAPSLLFLEVTNAVLVALRRERISKKRAYEIIHAVNGLSIPIGDSPEVEEIFELAIEHNLSAYDATYAALTTKQFTLITGDKKLYEALKKERKVMWIEDYKGAGV